MKLYGIKGLGRSGAVVVLRGSLLVVVVIFNFLFANAQERPRCSDILLCYPVDGIGSEKVCFNWADSTNTKIQDGFIYKVYVENCKGMGIMETYKNDRLLKRQFFANGLDTLKEYGNVINPVTLKEWISVNSYFEALEDGDREYWNKRGRLYKREKYTLGIKSW
jgi:hypothetical protein